MNGVETENEEIYEMLADCRELMKQVIIITDKSQRTRLIASDFKTVVQDDEK